jgi:ESCRT-I complex subunit TSG101
MSSNNSIEQTVQNYRYQYQSSGGNITRIKYDISSLLNMFATLRLQGGTFTFPNGKSASLLNLVGTVPITFQRAKYNIPVQIWISERYPATAPICYVTPTSDMVITPRHNNIQSDGKVVCFSDLDRWNSNSSNLVNLVMSLSNMFGRHPPCQAKPAGYGAGYSGGGNQNTLNPTTTQQYLNRNNNMYNNSGSIYGSNSHNMQYNASQQQQQSNSQRPPNYGNNNNGPPSYNAQLPTYENQLTRDNLNHQNNRTNNNTRSSKSSTTSVTADNTTSNSSGNNSLASKRAQLTERVKKEVGIILKNRQEQLNRALNVTESLDAGANKLDVGIKTLKEQENTLKGYIKATKDKNANIAEWLVENENKNAKNIDPDEVISCGDVWSSQIFDQVATISAIDDTLFELDDALKKGIIELNPFLRAVRNLASQQFQAKALAMKICDLQSQMMLLKNSSTGRNNFSSNSDNNYPTGQGSFSNNKNMFSTAQHQNAYSGYPQNFRK